MAVATNDGGSGRVTKRTKLDYIDTLTILLGANEARYIIHKNIACDTSDFFRTACNGKWKEAEGISRLPEVEENTFTIYLGWAYTGNIDIRHDLASKAYINTMADKDVIAAYDMIITTYQFGDMIQAAAFRNAVLDDALGLMRATNISDVEFRSALVNGAHKLIKGTSEGPSKENIQLLCERVPHRSAMRRLFVDAWADVKQMSSFLEISSELPSEFISEYGWVLVERLRYSDPECFEHEGKQEQTLESNPDDGSDDVSDSASATSEDSSESDSDA